MTTHEPRQLSRRGFLRTSGLTVGAALGTSAPIASAWPAVGADEFPRRVLGRTKLEVTSMTLGAAPSGIADDVSLRDIAEIVNLAIDLGINSIDTAPKYGKSEEGIGRALGTRRKEIYLGIGQKLSLP